MNSLFCCVKTGEKIFWHMMVGRAEKGVCTQRDCLIKISEPVCSIYILNIIFSLGRSTLSGSFVNVDALGQTRILPSTILRKDVQSHQ